MGKGATLDVVFSPSSVLRLYSLDTRSPNLFVKISTETVQYSTSRGSNEDPVHGLLDPNRVYHGVLEAYRPRIVRPQIEPTFVAVKWAQGTPNVESLRYEAALYQGELYALQGDVVPRFYGFFSAETDGVKIGCLVLQWCKSTSSIRRDELNRRRMLAVCRLHQAGVIHGNLRDARHFVLGQDGKVRIVDFSLAKLHHCPNEYPALYNEHDGEIGCEELYAMEVRLGISSGDWPLQA